MDLFKPTWKKFISLGDAKEVLKFLVTLTPFSWSQGSKNDEKCRVCTLSIEVMDGF